MREENAKRDLAIAEIAARQHGVLSVRQLAEAGVGKDGVLRRMRTGRLHRVHRGVYAAGHVALSSHGRWMAAVLACGRARRPVDRSEDEARVDRDPRQPGVGATRTILDHWGAALSHCSAARHWELLPFRDGPVDVSVSGGGGKSRRTGIRMHRSVSLLPADVTLRNGIPVTTPARTIADLRRVVSKPGRSGLISLWELRRAIRQADVLGLPIGDEENADRTRSDLERDFLQLCRHHRLPVPEVNMRIGPHLVDFLWRDHRVVVETDGYDYHRGRTAFQDDRARVLDLRVRGFDVIRVAEKQVNEEPRRVAEVVGAALRVRADG